MIKIVILGDWQYSTKDLLILRQYIEDINEYDPDYVIELGDYGEGRQLGTVDGIVDSAKMLSGLKCKNFYPILGNHDLQRETGMNEYPHGYIEEVFIKEFNLKSKNHIIEFENFRIFAFGLEPQPPEGAITVHECYMSDETIQSISDKVRERPGVPVIMCTHTPIIGCGLRTVPFTHVRACNAFINQNHNPYSLMELAKKHKEIMFWFSGHYHLGQHYENSHSYRFGTHFFTVGLMSSASRDSSRNSRLIEIEGNSVMVATYDHTIKKICDKQRYSFKDNARNIYMEHIYNHHYSGGKLIHSFQTASGNVVENGMVLGRNGMLYVLTDQECVWEINIRYGEAMGTLNYSDTVKISEIIVEENGILCITSNGNRLYRYDEPKRFMRKKDSSECTFQSVKRGGNYATKKMVNQITINLKDNCFCTCVSGQFLNFSIISE